MRRAPRFHAALVTAALLATPAPAFADRSTDRPAAAWWVETRPWTCARWAAPLAQEIELACDAGAGCVIAADERSASRRATLVCSSDDHWSLEARDRSDQVLWTLALDGSHQDRLRQAGVWVARSDMPDPPPLPADPPSPRASAPPELPDSLSEPEPAPAASDRPAAPHPSASGEPLLPGRFAFSASAQVGQLRLSTIPESWSLPVIGGNAAVGGLHGAVIAHSTHIYGGLSVVYEHSLTDFGGLSASVWRPGAVLGWGAPYGEGWWGVSGGTGIAFVSASQSAHVSWASSDPSIGNSSARPSQQTVVPVFLELAVHAKLPHVFGQHPFVSVSAADVMSTVAFAPGTFVGLDLGVVWND